MWVDVKSEEASDDGRVVMRVSVPARAMESDIEECLAFLGTRGGLGSGASRDDLAARFGARKLDELIARWFMERCSFPAVEQLHAPIACDPQCTAASGYRYGDDLNYTIEAYLLPHAELSSADPVTVAPGQVRVPDAVIDDQVRKLAERDARLVEVDPSRPVKMGDVVEVDTRVSRDGSPVAAYSRDNTHLRMQPGAMPTGFLEAVEGMLPDEIREFSFEAPAPLGEGTVEYDARVHVRKVSELRLPDLDDAWAREAWPGATDMASLRSAVADSIGRCGGFSGGMDEAVDAAISERLRLDLPDGLVRFVAEKMEADLCESLADNGLTIERHCALQGKGEEGLRAELNARASDSLRRAIALDALFEQRGMILSEDDIADALASLGRPDTAEAKRDCILAGKMHVVEEAARRAKAHRWLVETAVTM